MHHELPQRRVSDLDGQKTGPACGKGVIKVRHKDAGNIADHLRVQEIILHEPLDRRFALPLGKAHPCRDLLLQIEGQPVLGPSGDAMQMAADGPEKILRPLKLPQFAWREEANVDKFRHRTNAMHIFADPRSEEHTSELQSLMRISYAVFCLKKKKQTHIPNKQNN